MHILRLQKDKRTDTGEKHQRGSLAFTLIETLVAISILTIAITGPLAIIAQALRSSYFARDQITAYYLAQEAIEYIRNQRDMNGLKGVDAPASEEWLDGVATDTSVPDPLDPAHSLINPYIGSESDLVKSNLVRTSTSTGYTLTRCASPVGSSKVNSECPPLKYNTTYGASATTNLASLYGDEAGDSDSIFTREIVFSAPPPDFDPTDTDPTMIDPQERELIITVRVKWSSPAGNSSISVREHLTNWQLEKL
jgi:type II secretory pathway pseudopilin PulG